MSEIMYEILDESLQRAEMNHNITYGIFTALNRVTDWKQLEAFSHLYLLFLLPAILYECVKCIYTIHPKSDLLEKAAKCIGSFVLSPRINLKYLGKKKKLKRVQLNMNDFPQLRYWFCYCRLEGPHLRGPAGSKTSLAASDDHHRVSGSS